MSGNLLTTLSDFLKLIKQRVVLNGQLSSWSNIESGVPPTGVYPWLIVIFDLYKRFFRSLHNKYQALCRCCLIFLCSQ